MTGRPSSRPSWASPKRKRIWKSDFGTFCPEVFRFPGWLLWLYPPSPPVFQHGREQAVKGASHCRFRRPALDRLSRLCFSPASGGGISSRAAPFPKNGKGRGVWADLLHYKSEVFKMKRPLAYITAAWCGSDHENTKPAAQYCRTVYEAGFSPICPTLYQPLFLNDAVPEEHMPTFGSRCPSC